MIPRMEKVYPNVADLSISFCVVSNHLITKEISPLTTPPRIG